MTTTTTARIWTTASRVVIMTCAAATTVPAVNAAARSRAADRETVVTMTVENLGDVPLDNVQVVDDLDTTFPDPVTHHLHCHRFHVVGHVGVDGCIVKTHDLGKHCTIRASLPGSVGHQS